MAERFTKEYITLGYHPRTPFTEDALRDLVRLVEGYLQRMEGRIEVVQDAVTALQGAVTALQARVAALE